MILEPGTFRVSDHRKDIPLAIKLAVVVRQKACDVAGVPFTEADIGKINFDHRPPLSERPFDTVANDFIPPQLDPSKIFALRKGKHDERTFGRKEGAEKTVTTRGSDIGERARARNIRDTERLHQAKMAVKAGNHTHAAQLRAQLERPTRLTQKRKLQSRGFANGKRKMQSRKSLRRTKR